MNYLSLKKKLHGPIFSIITPFDKHQQIDFKKLRSYINYLYYGGAKVFYIMVYNSRYGLLSEQEIKKLNLFCIKVVKKLNTENIIICAEPYHCSTEKSIEYVKFFKRNGADIVSLIFGEKFYSEKQVLDHFKIINNKVKFPLLLHQQQIENGKTSNPPFVFYPISLLEKISNLKNFVAMKEDAKNDSYTRKIGKKLSKKIVIITSGGGKKQWIKASKHGCQSWLSGVSNLDSKIAIDFYRYYKEKNNIAINKIIKLIEDPFFRISKKYGWHLTIRSFLESADIFERFERRPLVELDKKNFVKIDKTFKEMKKKFNEKYFNIKKKIQ
jgi:4-hydroxy-tetrahydrodipicolinate synthase